MSLFLIFVFSLFKKLDSVEGNLDRLFYCSSRNPDRLSEFSVSLPNFLDRLYFKAGWPSGVLAILPAAKMLRVQAKMQPPTPMWLKVVKEVRNLHYIRQQKQ